MMNIDIQQFALTLAKADTEAEVINNLRDAGYWDDYSAWCDYGHDPMNFSTIGNQQSSADNALVEKLVNSVDAVLMRECLKQGIKPSGTDAPQSIAEAQKKFFNVYNGKLSSIDDRQRTQLAKNILLVATGDKKIPSLTIIDKGEGQSPQKIPETILSLTKDNKIKIPFVQGKFGMGGSGVLRFCSSENSVLLIISKRSHEIDANIDAELYGEDATRDLWGVTVVRREDPKDGEKSSRYTYLAPDGKVLSFQADAVPLLPGKYPERFGEPLPSGTFIKLYEYDIGPGLRSLIGFNLYNRLALLMPDVALPIRTVERREYKSDSYDITLAGLSVRLDEDKSGNLEPEFQIPSTGHVLIESEESDYAIYVFKAGKKDNYAKSEGIIFSISGQTHGFLSKHFFTRRAVGMPYLSDSILVTVDCSKISRRKQEELFMPSRDRLANTAIRQSIEKELEDIIKNHSGLRELQNKRRHEAIKNKIQDSKPLAEVLENIIKKSPAFASIFSPGQRISNPFNLKGVGSSGMYEGKPNPTYFNLSKNYSAGHPKQCAINRQFRVQYETDAENNYFSRDENSGTLTLKLSGKTIPCHSPNLWNGVANLTVNMPNDAHVGDTLCFEVEVSDTTRTEPFTSQFFIIVTGEANTTGGARGSRKAAPGEIPGEDRQKESRLDLPHIIPIEQADWDSNDYKDFGFNRYSALKIREVSDGGYDFYINMDNIYLQTEMHSNSQIEPEILKTRYRDGMVLLGLSIINFDKSADKNRGVENQINDESEDRLPLHGQISRLTDAISPILLPMIAHLGSTDFESR